MKYNINTHKKTYTTSLILTKWSFISHKNKNQCKEKKRSIVQAFLQENMTKVVNNHNKQIIKVVTTVILKFC